MKAVTFKKFGGPEVLEIQDIEIGKPGPKEVLVKNLSIGLNFIDTYHRSGLYPIPLPSGIGLEACGEIEEVGSEVKLFKVGDRVTHASMPIGAYAEKQIMPEDKLVSVPDGVSNEVASCITLKGITAEYLLHRAYPLKKVIKFYTMQQLVDLVKFYVLGLMHLVQKLLELLDLKKKKRLQKKMVVIM